MKIGQLTFHASHNYGSVLQSYALAKVLQKMGHTSEFINLRPKSQKDAYRIIKPSDKGIRLFFKLLIYPALRKRYNHYERFINNVLPISSQEYSSTDQMRKCQFDYDAYVVGGDQIWNPACQDFEEAYYLQFLGADDSARKISYSPSLGKHEFDEKTQSKFAHWLKCFDRISVREKRGVELMQGLTEKHVHHVCDPVLLLDKDEWRKLAIPPRIRRPYILVYFLENNHGSRGLIEYLRKTTGYDVVIFNEYIREFIRPYHKAYSASPEEFVGLFMNASFIYTNSFHGTAFATIFERPFITAIAENQRTALNNNDSRKIDYLSALGLEDRLYVTGFPAKEYLLNVDFNSARNRRDEFIKSSLDYLLYSLQ